MNGHSRKGHGVVWIRRFSIPLGAWLCFIKIMEICLCDCKIPGVQSLCFGAWGWLIVFEMQRVPPLRKVNALSKSHGSLPFRFEYFSSTFRTDGGTRGKVRLSTRTIKISHKFHGNSAISFKMYGPVLKSKRYFWPHSGDRGKISGSLKLGVILWGAISDTNQVTG